MKPPHYSEYFYNKLNRSIFVFILILFTITGVRLYEEIKMKNDIELVTEILALEKQLTALNDRIYRSEISLKLFNNDPIINSNPFVGIRPIYAKKIVYDLVNKYNLFGVAASFPVPIIRYETSDHKFISISYNKGNISFYSRSDLEAYQFVNDLENNIGGYFQITSMNVIKMNALGDEALLNTSKPMFFTKVQFIWQELVLNDQSKEIGINAK